jgi:putative ABC transport system substrate-binding protein
MSGMRRRDFIRLLGGAALCPLAARAQQGERVRRVAMLMGGAADDQVQQANVVAFRSEMARLGWIESRNLHIDVRFGVGNADSLRAYATELVSLAPDAIVTTSAAGTRAAQQQTQTIPIIITGVGDPVANGIVKSLAHPEGNTTGVTNLYASIGGKWLELLKEAAPKIERVALIYNDRVTPAGGGFFSSIEEAASNLAVQAIRLGYSNAVDLVHAIDAFGASPNRGLMVLPPAPIRANREAIVQLAIQNRLPTSFNDRQYVAEGGFIAYGSNAVDRVRRASSFVDRILRGTNVSELPIEYPTRFDLAINLKTAKAIGLTVPESFLLRANEIIE